MQFIPPRLKPVEGFNVIGLSTRTKNCDEFNPQTAKIPTLWQQFLSTGLANNNTIFGVYSDYETDANGLYTITLGIASEKPEDDFDIINIQEGHYLVFEATGPMPATVIATWEYIWDYFKTDNHYSRSYNSDFEAYNGPDNVAIYIGVK